MGSTTQQHYCSGGDSGTLETAGEPARPSAGRPDPSALFMTPMNKARSRSSTEYIRDQQTRQHSTAFTFILSSLGISVQHLLWGRSGKLPPRWRHRVHGEPCSRATGSTPTSCSRTTSSYAWESRPCRTWSFPSSCQDPRLPAGVSRMILQWARECMLDTLERSACNVPVPFPKWPF